MDITEQHELFFVFLYPAFSSLKSQQRHWISNKLRVSLRQQSEHHFPLVNNPNADIVGDKRFVELITLIVSKVSVTTNHVQHKTSTNHACSVDDNASG